MTLQLPLDLQTPDRFSRDRFVANAALQSILDILLADEWLNPNLILWGPAGSGKTHLGHIFAEASGACFIEAEATKCMDSRTLPDGHFVIDDAEQAQEDMQFHIYNRVQRTGHRLLLLTRTHPLQWDIDLPDLPSRLNAMRVIQVPEPDDELLGAILNKLFAERAISPSPDSIAYIAARMERSVAAAQKTVTKLEHYANGRPFNRALARDFFDQSAVLFPEGPEPDDF
jgi:chromosomal replication initiation ATPase DnaA